MREVSKFTHLEKRKNEKVYISLEIVKTHKKSLKVRVVVVVVVVVHVIVTAVIPPCLFINVACHNQ